MSVRPELPLDGIRVLDLTRALAGPLCTALLGDLGADVVKVEGLPAGDSTRHWPPFEGEQSLYYLSTNRNKRAIAMDLRSPEAKDMLARLVQEADALIHNFRPGVLPKLGLDPEVLQESRPDLVIASVTGFGPVGPMVNDAGLDQVAQGMSGLMSVTGAGDQSPMRVGVPISDIVTGLVTAVGVAAALAGVARRGRAHTTSTSLLESSIAMMTFQAQRYLSLGEIPEPQGNDHPLISPYGVFSTADEKMNVAVGNNAQFADFCRIIGAPELAGHPDYAEPAQRSANRAALHHTLGQLLQARTSAEWMTAFRAAGIPCGPIHTMDTVFQDPQVQALDLVQHVGRDKDPIMRGPLWIDGQASMVMRHPPALGEHTTEILSEIGYRPETIEDWIERGVVRQP